jgi:RNA polymerase sigma-70 factor (ECF subfamily)
VGKVYALCLRLIADPIQAEILTQDAFVRAWQKLSSYQERGSFAAWLRRLTVNVVVEDRRVAARLNRRLEPLPPQAEGRPYGPGAAAEGPNGSVTSSPAVPDRAQVPPAAIDTAIDLERAIAALPPGARLAFVLHDVEGYKHQEIATMTGLAPGTIKAQLHRARLLLRQALSSSSEEAES